MADPKTPPDRVTIDLTPQASFPPRPWDAQEAQDARNKHFTRALLGAARPRPLDHPLFATPPPAPRSRWRRLRDRIEAWRWRLASCRRILSGRHDFSDMPWWDED